VNGAGRPVEAGASFPAPLTPEPSAMATRTANALYVVLMIVVIVTVDILFFRHHFRERLAMNVGLVLVFIACYFRFLRHP